MPPQSQLPFPFLSARRLTPPGSLAARQQGTTHEWWSLRGGSGAREASHRRANTQRDIQVISCPSWLRAGCFHVRRNSRERAGRFASKLVNRLGPAAVESRRPGAMRGVLTWLMERCLHGGMISWRHWSAWRLSPSLACVLRPGISGRVERRWKSASDLAGRHRRAQTKGARSQQATPASRTNPAGGRTDECARGAAGVVGALQFKQRQSTHVKGKPRSTRLSMYVII